MTNLSAEDSFYLEQLRRCVEDWRHFDSQLWQIPFSTATVVGSILAVFYGYFASTSDIPLIAKFALLYALITFVIVMAFATRKIRLFQEVRSKYIKETLELRQGILSIPMNTWDVIEYFYPDKKHLATYSAVNYQYSLYTIFITILFMLLNYEGFVAGVFFPSILISIGFIIVAIVVPFCIWNPKKRVNQHTHTKI